MLSYKIQTPKLIKDLSYLNGFKLSFLFEKGFNTQNFESILKV